MLQSSTARLACKPRITRFISSVGWNQPEALRALRSTSSQSTQPSAAPASTTASRAQGFSTKADVKTKDASPDELSYYERKARAKEERRQQYFHKLDILERRRLRRVGKPRNVLKKQFHEWFDKQVRYEETMDRKSRRSGLEWKVRVAAVVERIPIILPDPEDWEQEYDDLMLYYSQFGKQYPEQFYQPVDPDEAAEESKVGYSDEDLLSLLPDEFVPAPRETEADLSGDVRTTNRRLKDFAFLLVKRDDKWMFPTVDIRDGETVLDASKRAVKDEAGGEGIKLYCASNCPMGARLSTYSEEQQKNEGFFGTKTFFMKVQYDDGAVSQSDMDADDFAWLDREETIEYLKHDKNFYYYLL